MKTLLFILLFSVLNAQQEFGKVLTKGVEDFFVDDYENIYLYSNQDFSFTKYNKDGVELGKQMFTLPFKIKSVQNPLNITAFSENAQEVRFFDQYLNTIQTLDLRNHFTQVKEVYIEDLQQIWVLDEGTKLLQQFRFRDQRILNSFPFPIDYASVLDFIIVDDTVYLLTSAFLQAYHFDGRLIFSHAVANPQRLRRENNQTFVLSKNAIWQVENQQLALIFDAEAAEIVDKNSNSYFELRGNKVYLYPLKK